MEVQDCIRLSKILDCIPFQKEEECGNFVQYLVQLKLVEAIYNKALLRDGILEQSNPMKTREHQFSNIELMIKKEPQNQEIWRYGNEQIYSGCDITYYLEDSEELLPFYALALVGAVNFEPVTSLSDDDIESYMSDYEDWFKEFLTDDEFESAIYDTQMIREEIVRAEKEGVAKHPLIKKAVEVINRGYLYGMGSEESICRNLGSYVAAFMTYGFYDAEVNTVGNRLLARYMKVRDNIPDSELKKAVEIAVKRFMEPIPVGMYGIEPITSIGDDWVAVTYVLGGTESGGMVTCDNMFPFWTLSLNILDVLLPIILD